MVQRVTQLATVDLVDRLGAVLPHARPRDTARRILEVMRRISRATGASAYRERAGMLRWIAGNRLPDAAVRAIRSAMRSQRGGALSIWIGEPGAEGWERSWVMWTGRPHDAERDVVYMQGSRLRAAEECGERLLRLAGLLGDVP